MTSARGGLFLSCGEVSGDGYAARIVHALRSRGYDGPVFGMVGPRGAEEGVESLRDARVLHLMGIADVLPAIPRLLKLKSELTKIVFDKRPDAVLLIDSPDFHLPFLAGLRKKGWRGPVIYAVPPTVWAWRSGRVKALARGSDICLPLFRFEHEYLLRAGVLSAWRGHPLVDEFTKLPLSLDADPKKIALLPGSRRSEVTHLLLPLKQCAVLLKERGYKPVFSIASGLPEDLHRWMVKELRDEETDERGGRTLMAESCAVAGASGTAAVEAMMLGKFMAVLYKGGVLSWLAWKTLVKTPYISIPNLLAGEEIYPELIQGQATGRNAFLALMGYIGAKEVGQRTDAALAVAKNAMGCPGALGFWSETVHKMLLGQWGTFKGSQES